MIAKQKFNLQDYCGLPLAVALDRLAEQAGVIDCEPERLEGGFVLHPDEGRRWVRLFFRRFIKKPDTGHERRPPLGATQTGDAYDVAQRKIAAKNSVGAAFVCAVGPLIEALKSGQIVAHGFVRGALKLEPIDPARWHMGWLIGRRDNTAVIEFFVNVTNEDADIEVVGVMLAAPEGVRLAPQAEARRAAGEADKPRKLGNRGANDDEALLRLIEILNGERQSMLGACTRLWKEAAAGKVKMKIAEPKALAKRLTPKLKKTHIIIEAADGNIGFVEAKQSHEI